MELERKVELLKQSYLHGYAAEWGGVNWIIKSFYNEGVSPEKGEEAIKGLHQNLGRILNHYDQTIPFYEITQEMGAEDWDDFAILFRVREVLPKVKEVFDEYSAYLMENNYYAPKDSEIVRRIWNINKEWFDAEHHQGMNLKARIEKYDPTFRSELAPLPK